MFEYVRTGGNYHNRDVITIKKRALRIFSAPFFAYELIFLEVDFPITLVVELYGFELITLFFREPGNGVLSRSRSVA